MRTFHPSRSAALVLVLSAVATGQPASRPLSGTDQRALDQEIRKFAEGSERERTAAAIRLLEAGPAARGYLRKKADSPESDGLPARILETMDFVSGDDLLKAPMDIPPSPWSLWTIAAGEVLVVRGDKVWTGVRIDPAIDHRAGTVTAHISVTKDPLLALGGPGVERSSVKVTGHPVETAPGRILAYPPKDYVVAIPGGEVVLRSAGSQAFRFRPGPGGMPVARTGQTEFRQVKAGDPKLKYADDLDAEAPARCRRVQQYLFRILDGVKPLQTYGTPEEAKYAHAEHVRVELREEAGGVRVLCVAFPHLESPPFDAGTAFLLRRFGVEAARVKPENILVWAGDHEATDVNRFWDGKAFTVPEGALQKRIRRLFPESY